jgi:hypothetical protein
MRSEVRDVLRPWLGEDLAVVEGLSDDQLAELNGVLEAARGNQARALAAASDEALRQMPAAVRRAVGTIVGRR